MSASDETLAEMKRQAAWELFRYADADHARVWLSVLCTAMDAPERIGWFGGLDCRWLFRRPHRPVSPITVMRPLMDLGCVKRDRAGSRHAWKWVQTDELLRYAITCGYLRLMPFFPRHELPAPPAGYTLPDVDFLFPLDEVLPHG